MTTKAYNIHQNYWKRYKYGSYRTPKKVLDHFRQQCFKTVICEIPKKTVWSSLYQGLSISEKLQAELHVHRRNFLNLSRRNRQSATFTCNDPEISRQLNLKWRNMLIFCSHFWSDWIYIYINISTSIATVQTHTDFKTAYLQGYVHGVGIFVNLEIPLIIDSIK